MMNKQTILLVEDYDAIRLLLKDYLERNGYQVLQATDGDEAVQIAKRECHHLDLILMDINLPAKDGIAATQLIREIEELCDVPIVACTANRTVNHRESAVAAGFTDFVAKPLDLQTVKTILHRYLPQG